MPIRFISKVFTNTTLQAFIYVSYYKNQNKTTAIFECMKGNYDNVAPFYDLLLRLVYGKAILRAQLFLIDAIQANDSILIVGGGTGQILEQISKKYTSGLQITYVDISKKMIALSAKKNAEGNSVVFINQSIADVTLDHQFDVIITPFFFDNFLNKTAKIIFNKIDLALKPNGRWLFADFQLRKNNLWQKLLLYVMYFFFKLLCNIEAGQLQDFIVLFTESNNKKISMQTFFKKFIYAVIYLKPDDQG